MNKKINFLSILLISIFLISCNTTVSFNVTRPAKLDLNGAKTISVLPFKPGSYYHNYSPALGTNISILDFFYIFDNVSPDEQRCLNYVKTGLEKGLMNSPHINLIDSNLVENAIKNNTTIPADVYFVGEVTDFFVRDDKRTEKIKVEEKQKKQSEYLDGNSFSADFSESKPTYRYEDRFVRNVTLTISYKVVDSKTNRIISFDSLTMRKSSFEEKRAYNLPSAYTMLEYDLERAVKKILQELQPYSETRYVELLPDKSKNPNMKIADRLADDGNIIQSLAEFDRIYAEIGLFEAGYNAAMLELAMGKLDVAEREMQDLCDKFNDPRAYEALADIRSEINSTKRLEDQINKTKE